MMRKIVAGWLALFAFASSALAVPIQNGPQAPLPGGSGIGLNTACMVGDSITAASNGAVSWGFSASGGTGPYTISVAGLSDMNVLITSTGALVGPSGGPAIGTRTVVWTVTDSASNTSTFTYSMTLQTNLSGTWTQTASTGSLGFAMTSQAYSYSDRGLGYWMNFLSNGAINARYDLNFGHTGDTTTQILARMPEIINAAPQCGFYTLLTGTNDLGSSANVANIEANITSILTQLLATGKPVILQTILPKAIPTQYPNALPILLAVDRWIDSLTGTNPNLIVVDNQQIYGDPFANDLSPRTYNQRFIASGGTAPYTWSATGLPSNVSIATNSPNKYGTLTSTATAQSSQTITVTVTDNASHTGSAQYVLNVNPALAQPISLGQNGVTSGTLTITRQWDYSYDGLHPKPSGALAVFTPVTNAALKKIASTGAVPVASNLDQFDATYNTKGNLLPGLFTNAAGSGTLSSQGIMTAAGVAPDGWQLQGADSGGTGAVTVTGSMVADSLGNPAYRMSLSGTGSAGTLTLAQIKYTTSALSNYSAGDALVASCHIEVGAGSTNLTTPFLYLTYTSGGINYSIAAGAWSIQSGQWNTDVGPNVAYSGTIKTPVPALPLPANPTGSLVFRVGAALAGGPSAATSGSITISQCSLNKA